MASRFHLSILHISDTHNLHRQLTMLPDADVVVHSGDFTMSGTEQEVFDFMEWFCGLPYQYKIFIAGNHDDCLYRAELSGLDKDCYYLCCSGVCIEGIKFYGIPLFMEDVVCGRDENFMQTIPEDTDVLITHQPPWGILDMDGTRRYGNCELLKKVELILPKLHLFGHIHAAFGTELYNGVLYSNAALVDAGYNLVGERVRRLESFGF